MIGITDPAPITAVGDPFVVGDPARGLERLINVELEARELAAFAGARFLAQRIQLQDDDPNPYPVYLKSLHVRNIAEASRILAETYLKKIEVVRASDGKLLGALEKTEDILGLNAGGVTIALGGTGVSPAELTVPDDGSFELEIYITVSEVVPSERKLQLATRVYQTEGGLFFFQERLEEAAVGAVFVTRAAAGLVGEDLTGRDAFAFARHPFVAQKILLTYRYPNDPNTCVLTAAVIKNVSVDAPVRDEDVLEIEIRTEAGQQLARTTSVKGLRADGVNLTLPNHLLLPGSTETLYIYFRLKDTIEAGRKLRLETEILHRSANRSLRTGGIRSRAEFITAVNHPYSVDFTFSPPTPRWDETITFTPNVRDDERDPVGRDPIVYSRWEFGDGRVVERNGPPEAVRHTYNKGGKFTVILLVRDDKGLESKASKEITLANQPPQGVDFDWSPKAPKWSDTITFTPSAAIRDPDGDIRAATFRW
ncbi:MAG: PKD domain-containing protein, partial [Candidatus Bipolaricaulaceae bacterium]